MSTSADSKMDQAKGKRFSFDSKFEKHLECLYKLMDNQAKKMYGYNVLHITLSICAIYIIIVTTWDFIFLHRFAYDINVLVYHTGVILNMLLACYKIFAIIMHYTNDIWKLLDITDINFLSYEYYNRNIFKNWRIYSTQISNNYIILSVTTLCIWCISPLLQTETFITVRLVDGSYSKNRLSIFNMMPVSDDTFNTFFYIFYFMELLQILTTLYITVVFDCIILIICFSVLSQLNTICDGIESLGYKICSLDTSKDNGDEIQLYEECDIYEDLKKIIKDHQNVIKVYCDFLKTFQIILLTEIYGLTIANITIFFTAIQHYSGGDSENYTMFIKLISTMPFTLISLALICNLFGNINDQIDAVTDALYNCNWTEVNMKSRKLVLYAMVVNNAVKPKLKFTKTKVVNLQMYASIMHTCYTVVTMLINYNKKKID